MRHLMGLLFSLYFMGAVVVGLGATYGVMTKQMTRTYDCAPIDLALKVGVTKLRGSPDWVKWGVVRAVTWPYAWWVEKETTPDLKDWLTVHYDPFPKACRL